MRIDERVSSLIQEILAEAQDIAIDGVREAFRGAHKPMPRPVPKRMSGKKRTTGEIEDLASKLYTEISAAPGSLMKALAPKVGATVRELNLPVRRLAAEGKVRSTGARSETRYFPVGSR